MSNNFKINNYRIMADQYLTDVLPVIPSNVILDKTITGCGATTAEIKTDRHSVIVIPYLPGIHSKVNAPEYAKYNLLGVFEGIKAPHIVQYLEKTIRESKHIKILTTPESFSRVVASLNHVGMEITRDCFLLQDESQNPVITAKGSLFLWIYSSSARTRRWYLLHRLFLFRIQDFRISRY